MQPTPGVLLGEHFRQALLEKNADRHMLRQGDARLPCTDFSSKWARGLPADRRAGVHGLHIRRPVRQAGEQQFP